MAGHPRRLITLPACVGALLLVGACASSSETPAPDPVPVPRDRPAAADRASQPRPATATPVRLTPETVEPDVDLRSAEVVKQWTLCKLLFAEAVARRTDRPTAEIVAATSDACATQEEQVRAWFVQRRMSGPQIAAALAMIRAGDREQLADRIIAARRNR
jgi:hypothetical protein